MVENSLDRSLRLAQTQQALSAAQARIAELEARLMAAQAEPSPPPAPPLNLTKCYQRLIEQRGDHITLLDAEGQILYTNAIDDLLGYTTGDEQSFALATLLQAEDPTQVQAFLQALQAPPTPPQKLEVCSRHKAGHKVWLELTATNLLDDAEVRAIVLNCRDITAHKRTEDALRRHRERYRSIVEDQLDVVCRYNTAFELTYVNQAYADLFGKAPAALLGVNFFTLIAPALHGEIYVRISALDAANPVAINEEPILLPSGETRWFQWVDRVLCCPTGGIIEYQAVGRDITAQKQLLQEQRLYTQAIEGMHQFLLSTLDAISASVAVLERDGTILNVNEYWKRFGLANGAQAPIGYCQENYLTICDAATGPQAAEAQPVANGIRAVIEGRAEQFYLEYPCHSPTEDRWYGLRVTPFAEPAPRRVVVAHINITERVQAELAERKQRHFAEALLDSLAALTGALDVDQALQQILAATADVIPSDAGSIILFEEEQCRVAYLRGYTAESEAHFKTARFPLTALACGTLQGQTYFVGDTHTNPNWISFSEPQWIRATIGAPIQLHGKVIGLICVDSATPNYFQPADAERLQAFAHYAGLALQNADHVSQLETRVAERTAELQTAKEQVEAVLDHSFDGILLVRPDLRIARTNIAFQQMFVGESVAGAPAADAAHNVFAETLSDLILGDDLTQVQTLIQRVLTTQVGEQVEIRCYQQNGTVFDAELSIGPIKGDGMVCTIRDITARKQAEAALRESEALYRLLADNITDWIARVNAKMEFIYVSPSARTLGYEPEELLGQQWFSLVHPDDLLTMQATQMDVLAQRRTTLHLTYRLWHKAGYYIWLETHGRILYDAETGEATEFIGLSNDISDRKQMEETLRESEARYRLLAENVTDLIGCTSALGLCTYISPSCQTLLGYAPEELIGQWSYHLIHPDDLPMLQATHSAVLAKAGAPPLLTYRMRHKAGHYIWLEMSSRNVCDPTTGEVMEFVNVARDISERKAAQAAEREQRTFLQQVLDNIPAIITVKNQKGEFQLINRVAAELYHATPDAMLGKTLADVHPIPAQAASFEQEDQAVLQSGCTSWRPEAASNERAYEVNRIPLKNVAGQIQRLLVVATDITHRKQAEAALRESEQKYRHLVEAIQGGLIITGMDQRITYVNERLCELIGYTHEEILGHYTTDFADTENAQVLHTEAAKRRQGESSSYEAIIRCKNGQKLHLLASASPLRNEQQEIIGTIAVVLDLETQKRAEAALRENLQKEKELGELKSRFVSMASHEFRTPLASILALTETLRAYRHKLADEQIDVRLGKIQEQIGYLKGIMEDVLQLARLQARRADFNPAPLDLDALCRSVLEEFQSRPEYAERLIYHCAAALHAIPLDKKLMRQVISNLVSNGLKYSPPGKPVTITLTYETDRLRLTVQDQGIGIPKADLPHLFEPFHRAANVGAIAGTGLGMVITKESVELHGGAITVQSQINIGTTVAVSIPYVTNSTTPTQAA